MPVESIIEFIQYVIPGFIAILIYRYAFPTKERDSFTEISSCILLGLITISALRWFDENCFNYYFQTNSSGTQSMRFYFGIILFGGIAGLIGVCEVKLRNFLARKYRFLRWLSKSPEPIWMEINKKTQDNWALVFLADDSIYLGWIKKYTYNPHIEEQEFLLTEAARVDDQLNVKYSVNGLGVYLNTKNVRRIEFIEGKKIP